MGFDDLSENDLKVYEFIKAGDFEGEPWSTPAAASALKLKDDDVYNALHNLARHVKDNIWIHYKNGNLRVSAE